MSQMWTHAYCMCHSRINDFPARQLICRKSYNYVLVCSNDAEFLWRLARAARDVALQPNIDAERRKQLTYEAFEYAKKALERNQECFAVHKVRYYFLKKIEIAILSTSSSCECSGMQYVSVILGIMKESR